MQHPPRRDWLPAWNSPNERRHDPRTAHSAANGRFVNASQTYVFWRVIGFCEGVVGYRTAYEVRKQTFIGDGPCMMRSLESMLSRNVTGASHFRARQYEDMPSLEISSGYRIERIVGKLNNNLDSFIRKVSRNKIVH